MCEDGIEELVALRARPAFEVAGLLFEDKQLAGPRQRVGPHRRPGGTRVQVGWRILAADVIEPGPDVVSAMDRVDHVDDPEAGQSVRRERGSVSRARRLLANRAGPAPGRADGVEGRSEHGMRVKA